MKKSGSNDKFEKYQKDPKYDRKFHDDDDGPPVSNITVRIITCPACATSNCIEHKSPKSRVLYCTHCVLESG